MKIALVHDWLTGMRGGEKCLEVLCRHFPNAPLFTLLHARGSASPVIEQMRVTTSFLQKLPGVTRYYRYLLPLMPAAITRLKIPHDIDLVISFSHAVAKSIRPPPGVPHICYCFTPMRYAWHRRADYFGTTKEKGAKWSPIASLRNYVLDRIRQWDHDTSPRVTSFVAISRTIAQRIDECYGRSSKVIYPPVDTQFYTPEETSRDGYYLCVSALVPYKRIDIAIEACRRLRRRLVIIGDGPLRKQFASRADQNITLLGWQTNEVIRNHMRHARALLFPGNEDFGIVPVEAQACGMPVLAYGQGGATETVLPSNKSSPGSGLFFEEQTVESLIGAIKRFEAHPDLFDPLLARRQAERFTAERFEREFLAIIEETI